jgi:tetratricopeptide (TPR) repeat protein
MQMKSIILFSIFCLSINLSRGQEVSNKLENISLQFMLNQKYDSAKIYYAFMANQSNLPQADYYYSMAGECYQNLNQWDSAIFFFTKSLAECNDKLFNHSQRKACLGLSDIYFKTGNFKRSLEYLNLAETTYPYRKICNAGEFERKLEIDFQYSKIFLNLNQLDSSIKRMTKYAFKNENDLLIDSSEYKMYIDYFISTLEKKYSIKEIKNEFRNSILNISYSNKLVNVTADSNKYYEVLSEIIFFGNEATIFHINHA